jgi:prepilin-type N-terminal cleavage/methylation domain-containing protein
MSATAPRQRRGFTLMELLVVVAILGLLSVIVLPNISGNINSRRYREAARDVSGFVARCQSRAIGAAEPRGVMIQPLTADPKTAIDLYFANTPEAYAGETSSSVAFVPEVLDATAGPLPVTFDGATQARFAMQPDFCKPGDAIQFGGRGAKYKFIPPNQVTMWAGDNQNPRNTSWPRAGGAGLPFTIWRQPTRGTGGALQLQKGAAVDLYWSCLGTRAFHTFMGTSMTDNSVNIMFDASGKPTEIVHSGGARTTVGEPIFLLIGEVELAGNSYDPAVSRDASGTSAENRGGANWQYGDCIWLCIDSNSGVVKSGYVLPGSRSVIESQRTIRLSIGYGVSER